MCEVGGKRMGMHMGDERVWQGSLMPNGVPGKRAKGVCYARRGGRGASKTGPRHRRKRVLLSSWPWP